MACSRATASASKGSLVTSGRSCFGRVGVLNGQKREPTPPARTTAQRLTWPPRSSRRPTIPTSSAARAYSFLGLNGFVRKSLAPSAMALVCCCSWPAAVRMMHGTVRQPIVGAHRGEHVETAQMRHHQIEQDEADVGLALEDLERLAAVVRERDAKRALLELHLDDAADVRFVIGDEHVVDSARSWTRSLRRVSRCVLDCGAARRAAGRCSRAGVTRTSRIASADSTETIARPLRMFEHGGEQLAAIAGAAELVRRGR